MWSDAKQPTVALSRPSIPNFARLSEFGARLSGDGPKRTFLSERGRRPNSSKLRRVGKQTQSGWRPSDPQ